jgi:hypothetical protein
MITLLLVVSFNSMASDLPDYDVKKEKRILRPGISRTAVVMSSGKGSGNIKRPARNRN